MVDLRKLLRVKPDINKAIGGAGNPQDLYVREIRAALTQGEKKFSEDTVALVIMVARDPNVIQTPISMYDEIMEVLSLPLDRIRIRIVERVDFRRVFNAQEWLELKTNRNIIPKPAELVPTKNIDEITKLKKYTQEVNELRNEFLEELKKINPPHKGGIIQTVRLKNNTGRTRDILPRIDDLEISPDKKEIIRTHIEEEIEVNAFGNMKIEDGGVLLKITTNSNDMRRIRRLYREIKTVQRTNDWSYNTEGKFQKIDADTLDNNKQLLAMQEVMANRAPFLLSGTKKHELWEVNDSNTPIEIYWPIIGGVNFNLFSGASGLAWEQFNQALHNDVLIRNIDRIPSHGGTFFNPSVAAKFFNTGMDKSSYINEMTAHNMITLPHLYIRITRLQPDTFPTDEVTSILDNAILKYINDFHTLFVEEGYNDLISGVEDD